MGPYSDEGGGQFFEPERERRLYACRIQPDGSLNFRACEAREEFFPSIVPYLQLARNQGPISRLVMKTSGRAQAGKLQTAS